MATQTTASVDAENHIPRYHRLGAPGEKNASVKEPPTETSVWSPVILRRPSFRASGDETPEPKLVPIERQSTETSMTRRLRNMVVLWFAASRSTFW